MGRQGSAQLILRQGRLKPLPEQVTLAQYTSANARIMAKLIADGRLNTCVVIFFFLFFFFFTVLYVVCSVGRIAVINKDYLGPNQSLLLKGPIRQVPGCFSKRILAFWGQGTGYDTSIHLGTRIDPEVVNLQSSALAGWVIESSEVAGPPHLAGDISLACWPLVCIIGLDLAEHKEKPCSVSRVAPAILDEPPKRTCGVWGSRLCV